MYTYLVINNLYLEPKLLLNFWIVYGMDKTAVSIYFFTVSV